MDRFAVTFAHHRPCSIDSGHLPSCDANAMVADRTQMKRLL